MRSFLNDVTQIWRLPTLCRTKTMILLIPWAWRKLARNQLWANLFKPNLSPPQQFFLKLSFLQIFLIGKKKDLNYVLDHLNLRLGSFLFCPPLLREALPSDPESAHLSSWDVINGWPLNRTLKCLKKLVFKSNFLFWSSLVYSGDLKNAQGWYSDVLFRL